ncbi:hypothetical protein COO60DRAFT_1503677 [Scenedesmus sp. NREL 46B-D3]|nr:hypothetical protein COO60DRAFT_1503677 [Scenedesmus sp. NREL 46B-D3]
MLCPSSSVVLPLLLVSSSPQPPPTGIPCMSWLRSSRVPPSLSPAVATAAVLARVWLSAVPVLAPRPRLLKDKLPTCTAHNSQCTPQLLHTIDKCCLC